MNPLPPGDPKPPEGGSEPAPWRRASQQTPESAAKPASPRVMALRCLAIGAAMVGLNVLTLWLDGTYYPVVLLFGLPATFAGVAGFLLPSGIAQMGGATPTPPPGDEPAAGAPAPNGLAVAAVFLAGLIGLLVGGYLVYDPGVLLDLFGI